mmetsp:Transcript_21252/g.50518  ORF Transcript_21252/g.50518 Transcript_21252/m.50518 type:complete len:349 (+) Transcript_21252:773-1819(+)
MELVVSLVGLEFRFLDTEDPRKLFSVVGECLFHPNAEAFDQNNPIRSQFIQVVQGVIVGFFAESIGFFQHVDLHGVLADLLADALQLSGEAKEELVLSAESFPLHEPPRLGIVDPLVEVLDVLDPSAPLLLFLGSRGRRGRFLRRADRRRRGGGRRDADRRRGGLGCFGFSDVVLLRKAIAVDVAFGLAATLLLLRRVLVDARHVADELVHGGSHALRADAASRAAEDAAPAHHLVVLLHRVIEQAAAAVLSPYGGGGRDDDLLRFRTAAGAAATGEPIGGVFQDPAAGLRRRRLRRRLEGAPRSRHAAQRRSGGVILRTVDDLLRSIRPSSRGEVDELRKSAFAVHL